MWHNRNKLSLSLRRILLGGLQSPEFELCRTCNWIAKQVFIIGLQFLNCILIHYLNILRFGSFNSHRASTKLPIVPDLCNSSNVLFLHEIWVMPNDLSMFDYVSNDFLFSIECWSRWTFSGKTPWQGLFFMAENFESCL